MRILSQLVTIIGLCLGVFALIGLYSYGENKYFLGLDIVFLQIDLLVGIFVSALGLAMMLCLMIQDRVNERAADRNADAAEGEQPTEDIPLCPSCLTPAKPHQHFCMNCWAPLTSHAEIDPLGRVYAMGDVFWKLTRGPSKPIAIIGLWVMVGLPLVGGMVAVIAWVLGVLFSDHNIGPAGICFTMAGGMAALVVLLLPGMFLTKAIRNRRRPDLPERPCYEDQEEKRAESAPDNSGDNKHPPPGSTEFGETRDE